MLSGVRLSPLGTAATTGRLYQTQMIDDDDCGATGGMNIGRGNRSTRRKPAPVPLRPPQIPHDLTPGSNSGRCGGKPGCNRLSYSMANIVDSVMVLSSQSPQFPPISEASSSDIGIRVTQRELFLP
jgi:hypothetical protein